jgi:uncharacterized membrane protein YdjX (TVP38/TMEM64 family)
MKGGTTVLIWIGIGSFLIGLIVGSAISFLFWRKSFDTKLNALSKRFRRD